MVDEVRVARLLRGVTDELAFLSRQAAVPGAADDETRLRAVKYALVTAIEAAVDVAQHVCSSEGWGPPADNGDAMLLLGRQGFLSREVATEMRRAVGFRNVLVHQYADVDDAVVVARLADLTPLEQFVSEVTTHVR